MPPPPLTGAGQQGMIISTYPSVTVSITSSIFIGSGKKLPNYVGAISLQGTRSKPCKLTVSKSRFENLLGTPIKVISRERVSIVTGCTFVNNVGDIRSGDQAFAERQHIQRQ